MDEDEIKAKFHQKNLMCGDVIGIRLVKTHHKEFPHLLS